MIYSINEAHKPFAASDALREASAEDLRVLLCLLEAGSADEEALAAMAGCSASDAAAALAFWRGAGFVKRGGKTAEAKQAASTASPVARERRIPYTADEIGNRIDRYGLASLISACQQVLGKELGRVEMDSLVYCVEQLALGGDYILMLLAYCKELDKPSFRYLEKMAISLADKEITNVGALEKYIENERLYRSKSGVVRHVFGIVDRAPSTRERAYMEKWIVDFGYGEDMIRHAYDITVNNTGKAAMAYADKLLAGWHENGCKTVEDAEAHMTRERAAKGIVSKGKKAEGPPPAASFDVNDAWEKALRRSYGEE